MHQSQKFWFSIRTYVRTYVRLYVKPSYLEKWESRFSTKGTSLILNIIHNMIFESCQNKVSADRYPVTRSRARFKSSSRSFLCFFGSWPMTRYWVFVWIKLGYYSEEEWGSAWKGKISALIKLWLDVDFSSDIFLSNIRKSLIFCVLNFYCLE